MQSYALNAAASVAILATQAEALMYTGKTTTTVSTVGFATLTKTRTSWGYDATGMYFGITGTMKPDLALAATVGNQLGMFGTIHGFTSKFFAMGCVATAVDATNYTGKFSMHEKATLFAVGTANGLLAAADNLNAAKVETAACSSTAKGSVCTAVTKTATDWTVLSGTMTVAIDGTKDLTCDINVKYNKTVLADNKTAEGLAATFAIASKPWFCWSKIGATKLLVLQAVENAIEAIADAGASVSGIKYSGAGTVVAAISSTVSAIDTWTVTDTVKMNFEFEMNLTAVMAVKQYEQSTCTQLEAAKWMCVIVALEGAADGNKWVISAMGSAVKPAVEATAHPLASSVTRNLGNLTKFYTLFKGDATKVTPGVQNSTKTAFKNNSDFAWSTTGNKWTKQKVNSTLSYISKRADTAAAAKVVASSKAYNAAALTCAYTSVGSPVAKCGNSALAAPAVTPVAVTGALAMATAAVGVAALALAF